MAAGAAYAAPYLGRMNDAGRSVSGCMQGREEGVDNACTAYIALLSVRVCRAAGR